VAQMAMRSLSPVELERRRPVWNALSSLFLDTDTSLDRDWRAQQLASSPYSMDEIEEILIDEVYPICRWNLVQVAGEWAGFDPEWLESRIVARGASPLRFLHMLNVFRFTVVRSQEWQETKSLVWVIRSQSGYRRP
jgi:hypothetical protein